MKQGIEYNKNEPRLLWETGWTISQKIGRADEHKYYRRLFKADDEFNGSRPLALRDNWLVGKEWFQDGYKTGRHHRQGRGRQKPLDLSFRPDHVPDELLRGHRNRRHFRRSCPPRWKKAADEWFQYGSTPIPSTYGVITYLNDKEKEEEQAKKLVAELDALQPGLRKEISRKNASN